MENSFRSYRISALDGMRAVAIILVIFSHLLHTIVGSHSLTYEIASAMGRCGVNIFFVLSGYLITSLLVKEHEQHGKIDITAFLARRARRIFPAYYAFLILIGIIASLHIGVHLPFKNWIMDATYLSDYDFKYRPEWTAHTWSLSLEEQFYLLWPIMLAFLGFKNGLTLALGCIVLDPLIRIASYAAFPEQRELITVMFHTRCDMLMYGCGLAIVLARPRNVFTQFFEKRGLVTVTVALVLLVVNTYLDGRFRGTYLLPVGFTIAGLSTVLIIAYILAYPSSLLSRTLSATPLTWLGRISYSLYLWQQPFFNPSNHGSLGTFPLNIICAMTLACTSYYAIELPFLAMRSRQFKAFNPPHRAETSVSIETVMS